jgi:3-oxoacyl-[acyl-carrier protein] reductase
MVVQRVIVTGAASGIGLATARAFARSGAQVLGLDIATFPDDVTGIEVDIADPGSIAQAVGEACARLGGLDVLVNCAGVEFDAPLAELDIAALDRMFAINLRGPMLVAKAMPPAIARPRARYSRSPGPGRGSWGRRSGSMRSHPDPSTRLC